MGDEPRRSVRATKGHHSKIDLADEPIETKKKTTKKGSKKVVEEEPEEEEEVIRCVCGATETDNGDEDGAWIACDKCQVWQHNTCMDISPFEDEVPDSYLCEQHDPVFHKELLDAMKNGIPIWEARKKKWALILEKKAAAESKKGKKGKTGKKASDHANGNSNPPSKVSTPVPEAKKATPAKSSTKRKDRHESQELPKEPQAKVRKVTAPAVRPPQEKTPPSDGPTRIEELDVSRQGFAKLIKKSLEKSIPDAAKQSGFRLAQDDTYDGKSERLSVRLAEAIYKTHPDHTAQSKQARTISANLKSNLELTIKLLNGNLTPAGLAVLSSDDMASSALKKETAAMKARADKQSILLTEEDTHRIRKTHKGEEIVGEENIGVPEESTMSAPRRPSMTSREGSSGNKMELSDSSEYRALPVHNSNRHALPSQPLNIETKNQPARRQSTQQQFDINNVYSHVQSPTGPPSHARRQSTQSVPQPKPVEEDPDIDRLLQGDESPPYSPTADDDDPELVWRGNMIMDSIATFTGSAKHVGGADVTLSRQLKWSEILQKDLRIAGRIAHDKANEYLCSLRYSPPTDVVIVHVTSAGSQADMTGFKDMFDYFHTKSRYGVLTNKGIGNVRDTYLVPLAPGDPFPDFLINLEGHKISESRSEEMMLVVLVVRTEFPPQHIYDGVEAPSPTVPPHPTMRNPSLSGPIPAMSPIAPQNASFPASSQPPHTPAQSNLAPPQQDLAPAQLQHINQQEGERIATQILGDLRNAPTVGFLMPQAFQMRPLEWEVVKEILQTDERSRTDLAHLSQILDQRMQQPPPSHQSPSQPSNTNQNSGAQ
ncbi:SPOC domain-containing protein [Bisporella sp. PMI_857]|nr:SPOC domain-containing protein [Bisporella sp. PMI_857]